MGAPLPDVIQTAVITGAAHGFGAEVARRLHADGFRVVVTDIDAEAAEAQVRDLDLAAETAIAATLDVSKPGDFQTVLDKVVDRWGSVEVLVNNAALTQAKPVLDIDPDEFNRIMAINAGGTFAGCQTFGRHMKDRGFGRIVNMASLAGQNGGTATGAHYAASKGAILTLTKVFARDLAPFGITVNAVSPGPMDTPMVRDIVGDKIEGFLANVPTGQLGQPAYVAKMVSMLVAADAGFVTGACWDANGGLFMR
ncbi:MAG: SDR family oxidoreductase [Pseudomonadota bacterium]|nr:SDR family oxidoreductase [Pseudomonadota bacterium]